MLCETLYRCGVCLLGFLGVFAVVLCAFVLYWIAKAAFLEARFLWAGSKALQELEDQLGPDFAPWWRREFAIYTGFALGLAGAMWLDLNYPAYHIQALSLFFAEIVLAIAAILSLNNKGVEYHSAQLSLVLQKHDE